MKERLTILIIDRCPILHAVEQQHHQTNHSIKIMGLIVLTASIASYKLSNLLYPVRMRETCWRLHQNGELRCFWFSESTLAQVIHDYLCQVFVYCPSVLVFPRQTLFGDSTQHNRPYLSSGVFVVCCWCRCVLVQFGHSLAPRVLRLCQSSCSRPNLALDLSCTSIKMPSRFVCSLTTSTYMRT